MKKSLFNFYLDDEVKANAQNKLKELCGEKEKGQLGALLRVLLNKFVSTPNEKIEPSLIDAISTEYVYSQTLNKRSRM